MITVPWPLGFRLCRGGRWLGADQAQKITSYLVKRHQKLVY